MIISDEQILKEVKAGNIVIEPFMSNCLGSNSYDLHLGRFITTYQNRVLDTKLSNGATCIEIPADGLVLEPGVLYLGVTLEYTETHKHIPMIAGKSSLGRLGIQISKAQGMGDVGFCNHWTLDITVTQSVRIYAGMPIGQLYYFEVMGAVNVPYAKKNNPKYAERSDKPTESMMWKNKF